MLVEAPQKESPVDTRQHAELLGHDLDSAAIQHDLGNLCLHETNVGDQGDVRVAMRFSAVLKEARSCLANAAVDLRNDITDVVPVPSTLNLLMCLACRLHIDNIRYRTW